MIKIRQLKPNRFLTVLFDDGPAKRRAGNAVKRHNHLQRRSDPMLSRCLWYKIVKNTYGLSPEEYDKMLISSGGKCEICLEAPRRLVVDHCHETGKVRGLLCSSCNSLLGLAADDLNTLKQSIAYLTKIK